MLPWGATGILRQIEISLHVEYGIENRHKLFSLPTTRILEIPPPPQVILIHFSVLFLNGKRRGGFRLLFASMSQEIKPKDTEAFSSNEKSN